MTLQPAQVPRTRLTQEAGPQTGMALAQTWQGSLDQGQTSLTQSWWGVEEVNHI